MTGISLGVGANMGFAKYPDPTTATVDAIFKEFYLPSVNDLLNRKRILSRFIRRNTEDVAGSLAVTSLNIGGNEGIGFAGEQGLIPLPGKQQYEDARYRMRYAYGRILFTGPAVASSRNQRGAFIRIMDGEIRGVARDLQHEMNRIYFGDGSGRLARITGTSGTSVVVADPGGFTNSGPGTQYLRPGMRVCFIDSTLATLRQQSGSGTSYSFKILSVDPSSGAITVDGGGGTAGLNNATANDVIVRANDVFSTSAQADWQLDMGLFNEPWGLAAIVDESNPYGGASPRFLGQIDADAEGIWNAAVVDNAGVPVPFNQDMLQQAEDQLDIQSDNQVGMWMTTHGIRRQYIADLVANKRYVGTHELDGGWTAIDYNGRALVVDKDCTRGRIYGLDLENLMLFTETDFQWMDADGSILQRLPNNDAYQATIYRYLNLGTNARNFNVVIKDVIDS